jgi:pyridoxal phosphate enzyme (YggS family)
MNEEIYERVRLINQNIEKTKAEFGIKEDIKIVAATKTKDAQTVNALYDCGIRIIGENRVQEFLQKYPELNPNFETHFIGRLQTNKVKYIIDKVSLIHSLDRISLAEEIDKRAHQTGKKAEVLIEVNFGEQSKGGVESDKVLDFYKEVSEKYDNIIVRGLMSVMPVNAPDEMYLQLRRLYDILKTQSNNIKYLSAGMSDDYLKAIRYGANMIRLGRVLLGERI